MKAGNKLRVGSDLDGCVDNFSDGVLETLKRRGLGHLWKSGPTESPFWNFYEDWGWDFAQFKELVDWGVDQGYIFSGNWRPGGLDALRRISAMGHDLILITDRSFGSDPMNSQRNTRAGFERAGVGYTELHFTADKTSVPVDIMVEDKLENYDALVLAGVPTYLINRPWNHVEGGDGRNRIDDMQEYADIVENVTKMGFADLTLV